MLTTRKKNKQNMTTRGGGHHYLFQILTEPRWISIINLLLRIKSRASGYLCPTWLYRCTMVCAKVSFLSITAERAGYRLLVWRGGGKIGRFMKKKKKKSTLLVYNTWGLITTKQTRSETLPSSPPKLMWIWTARTLQQQAEMWSQLNDSWGSGKGGK